MKDFSRKRKSIRFQVDDDVFEATPAIPAEVLTSFAVKFSDVDNLPAVERVSVLTEVLEMVLKTESFKLFRVRMNDRDNPIELDQINEVIMWLMEQYGQRPTQPLSESQTGQRHPESGTNSQGSTSVAVSTFNP